MVSSLSEINSRLELFLKQKSVASRDGAKAGILLSPLLPLCILKGELGSYFLERHTSLWIPTSFGLLLHSVLNIIYLKRNSPIYTGLAVLPSAMITSFLSFILFDQGVVWKGVLGCIVILAYDLSVLNLMKLCPKAFTYGEACVVAQGVALFTTSCFNPPLCTTCLHHSTVILKVGFVCMVVISVASFTLSLGKRPAVFVLVIALVVSCLLVPILFRLTNSNPFLWIFHLVSSDFQTSALFCWWVFLSLVGTAAVLYQVHIKEKASTVVRKSFHVLTLLVYLPGILINTCLLYLATGVVFALFIMTDVVRLSGVAGVSGWLEAGFRVFSDEKDGGGLSLTPLYLVAGCSLPLWLHPTPGPQALLPLLSGLLTVAVGDTAASVCGSAFGRNKWTGTNKTKEGTIACFISQLFFIIALIHFGYLPRKDLIRPVLAVAVSSVVEARTTQVDNLVLPLLMYLIVV